MAFARLKCECGDEQMRDAQIEGWLVGIGGTILGMATGFIGTVPNGGRANLPYSAALILLGIGGVVASIVGIKPFTRWGIPGGGGFINGVSIATVYSAPVAEPVKAAASAAIDSALLNARSYYNTLVPYSPTGNYEAFDLRRIGLMQ